MRLALETGDHGLLQLTGRRCWLRLFEPDPTAPTPVTTELVFIGAPGTTTDAAIAAVFEEAVREQAAIDLAGTGHVVDDLRSFDVVFA